MQRGVRNWLNEVALADPVQRQQAPTVQIFILVLLVGALLTLPIFWFELDTPLSRTIGIGGLVLAVLGFIGSIVLLRRGYFWQAVVIATTMIIVSLGSLILVRGMEAGQGHLIGLTVPIVMSGLLLGRRGLFFTIGFSSFLVVGASLLEALGLSVVRLEVAPSIGDSLSSAAGFIVLSCVLGLMLDRFGSTLQDALTAAMVRQEELERMRASLEKTVAERTVSLREALQVAEQREVRLVQTLEELQTSQNTIRDLSAPVIPVLPGVLVAPIIGVIDNERANILAENILRMVERSRARYVIFDITGVPVVDTQVAQALLGTATAVQLIGAHTLLVGIRPEVAQTIVALRLDLGTIQTYPDLQEAVQDLLAKPEFSRSKVATKFAVANGNGNGSYPVSSPKLLNGMGSDAR